MPLTPVNNSLLRKVLEYFSQPNRSWEMYKDKRFDGYARREIYNGLRRAASKKYGLIVKVRGQRSGSIYVITDKGRDWLSHN